MHAEKLFPYFSCFHVRELFVSCSFGNWWFWVGGGGGGYRLAG